MEIFRGGNKDKRNKRFPEQQAKPFAARGRTAPSNKSESTKTNIRTCMYVSIFMHVHVYVSIFMYVHVYVSVCICVC